MNSATHTAAPIVPADGYRFEHPRLEHVMHDMWIGPGEAGGGDPLPVAFDLELLDGGRLRSTDLRQATRPLLLVFGSQTCPVTESAVPGLAALHRQYGSQVRFVMVQVREAHPGQAIPQPRSMAEKRNRAAAFRSYAQLPFEVAIDDLDGEFHRAMGARPNSLFVISTSGHILFSAQWANETASINTALAAIVANQPPASPRITRTVPAMMKAMGFIGGVVQAAGSGAAADMWKIAPPMMLITGLADRLTFLPKAKRGLPAGLLMMAMAGAAAALLVKALR